MDTTNCSTHLSVFLEPYEGGQGNCEQPANSQVSPASGTLLNTTYPESLQRQLPPKAPPSSFGLPQESGMLRPIPSIPPLPCLLTFIMETPLGRQHPLLLAGTFLQALIY